MSRKLIIGMMDKTVPFWSHLVVPTALQKGGLFLLILTDLGMSLLIQSMVRVIALYKTTS
ncbi:hypothetical protein [Paenibacillus polymyxa]|uniref:hypothetical protein n=1 Tax=Paenibacillus polymyxa TaxID=1406 RepID=UPI0012DB2A90|nr:hypothetical protein [Paenibacillus polymyxa]